MHVYIGSIYKTDLEFRAAIRIKRLNKIKVNT